MKDDERDGFDARGLERIDSLGPAPYPDDPCGSQAIPEDHAELQPRPEREMKRRPDREAIGFYGTQKDAAGVELEKRPTFRLCNDPDLPVAKLHLLHFSRYATKVRELAEVLRERSASKTVVVSHALHCDPWDLGKVEAEVSRVATAEGWDREGPERLVHLTTGTDAGKSVLVFLAGRRRIAGARLVETDRKGSLHPDDPGTPGWSERLDHADKHALSGVVPQSPAMVSLTDDILRVARRSNEPILLLGPPGTGKSELARQIERVKLERRKGRAIVLNCGAVDAHLLRSELFGHEKGAFTGATKKKTGLLKLADKGIVFLDEVGELDLTAQAQLLRALEEKAFLPVGATTEEKSDFELIAATNQDLSARVREGRFREDLLGRISTWTFNLPTLRDRIDDLYRLVHERHLRDGLGENAGDVTFDKDAWKAYDAFARSSDAVWPGNLRDLRSSVRRMRDLAEDKKIRLADVRAETERLRFQWARLRPAETGPTQPASDEPAERLLREHGLDPSRMHPIDVHLAAHVLRSAAGCRNLADLGRRLFRTVGNPSSRANKLLRQIEQDGNARSGSLSDRLFREHL